MKTSLKSLALLAFLAAFLLSCKKEKKKVEEYPPLVLEYFSCKVNGEAFIPKGQLTCYKWKTFYDPDGVLNTEPGYLTISAQRCSSEYTTAIGIGLTPVFDTVMYYFDNPDLNRSLGYYVYFQLVDHTFMVYEGWVDIKKLEPQTYQPFIPGWIEGTFEMSCANESGDTVHITEGTFGLRLR